MRHGLILPGNAVNRRAPLNRGLVSWWMVLPNRVGGGGNTFRDLCGRNHGTLTNGPTWSGSRQTGGYGSLNFASTARVAASVPGAFTSFTVSAWFRWQAWQTSSVVIEVGTRPNLRIERTGSNLHALVLDNGTYQFPHTGTAVDDGRWHHIAAVWIDSTSLTVYLDGVQKSQDTSVGTQVVSSPLSVTLGNSSGGGSTSNWNGDIDDVRIYPSRALSAAEIAALYQASRLGYPNELNWIQRPAFATEQGGGGGFNPVYARWSNIVIQPLTAA